MKPLCGSAVCSALIVAWFAANVSLTHPACDVPCVFFLNYFANALPMFQVVICASNHAPHLLATSLPRRQRLAGRAAPLYPSCAHHPQLPTVHCSAAHQLFTVSCASRPVSCASRPAGDSTHRQSQSTSWEAVLRVRALLTEQHEWGSSSVYARQAYVFTYTSHATRSRPHILHPTASAAAWCVLTELISSREAGIAIHEYL